MNTITAYDLNVTVGPRAPWHVGRFASSNEACDYLSARDDLQGYFCDIEGWKGCARGGKRRGRTVPAPGLLVAREGCEGT
jgi:hypothetical protein